MDGITFGSMGTTDGRTGAAQSPGTATTASDGGDESSASRAPLGGRDGSDRADVHILGHGVAADRTLPSPYDRNPRPEPARDHDLHAPGGTLNAQRRGA